MAATTEQAEKLRRYVAESTSTIYTNDDLIGYIESYPLVDADGNEPSESDWTPTYDLHAAAAEIWEEKAASVAADFDFSADGGTFNRSQVHAAYLKQVKAHKSKAAAGSVKIRVSPEPLSNLWIGNLSEENSNVDF